MTPRESLLRVAVDVTPRLFSDALTRVLEHHQVEVVTLPSGDATDDRLDVVVTSANTRGHLPADVLVVEVRPGAGPGNSTHTSPALNGDDAVRSLDDLMAIIRRFAGPVEPTPA